MTGYVFFQFSQLFQSLRYQLNEMLRVRHLEGLITPTDVDAMFDRYTSQFKHYAGDSLWPTFKYPLTDAEMRKLAHQHETNFNALAGMLDDVAVRVKYGGEDKRLMDKTLHRLSFEIKGALVDVAFLRTPPISGVTCRYTSPYGFLTIIENSVFEADTEVNKGVFAALKYFHLGHLIKQPKESPR